MCAHADRLRKQIRKRKQQQFRHRGYPNGSFKPDITTTTAVRLLLDKAASFSSQKDIAVPVAEAKFFRAYSYFDLVQLYGNVILVTKPLDMTASELQQARTDRSQVIALCIKDLQEAAAALPETVTETGRLT
ncbi:MAG: RagB/SusD family nutrient uptake outer membrane protein, partial [Ruminococcus sp.]|nr:RagB/SusD family nutrient uptake outer membrane protein [Ruminococcus sp.]